MAIGTAEINKQHEMRLARSLGVDSIEFLTDYSRADSEEVEYENWSIAGKTKFKKSFLTPLVKFTLNGKGYFYKAPIELIRKEWSAFLAGGFYYVLDDKKMFERLKSDIRAQLNP